MAGLYTVESYIDAAKEKTALEKNETYDEKIMCSCKPLKEYFNHKQEQEKWAEKMEETALSIYYSCNIKIINN